MNAHWHMPSAQTFSLGHIPSARTLITAAAIFASPPGTPAPTGSQSRPVGRQDDPQGERGERVGRLRLVVVVVVVAERRPQGLPEADGHGEVLVAGRVVRPDQIPLVEPRGQRGGEGTVSLSLSTS